MPKMNNMLIKTNELLDKYSPEILTGIGIFGMITTTVLAIKATPKALKLIENKKEREDKDDLTVKEAVKETWKCYIPVFTVGCLSITCLISSNRISLKRTAIMSTAYKISEEAFKKYNRKVFETIGEKKTDDIKNSIIKDEIDSKDIPNKILANDENIICYDVISGRFFQSNKEEIKRAVNNLNKIIIDDGYASLNDFYYELKNDDMNSIKVGDDLGWFMDDGLLEVKFSSGINNNGIPYLVMEYDVSPKYYKYY